ncbi:MAG: hypothetical protein JW863_04245 [Chitinispirillaceae bacterium]|nr:hypothetical protein [Chitinispirillaceae bacterium]
MAHLIRFLFWSVGFACIAWIIKQLSAEVDTSAPETLVNRLRENGF